MYNTWKKLLWYSKLAVVGNLIYFFPCMNNLNSRNSVKNVNSKIDTYQSKFIATEVRDIIFYHGISLHVEYVIVCHKDERNVETELSKQI